MAWTGLTEAEAKLAADMALWIRTARAAGYGGPDWVPDAADIAKSALFERIRSGKEPLPHPPPIGLACPWYAVVEDAGPHWVGDATGPHAPLFHGDPGAFFVAEGQVAVLMNRYAVVERRGERDYVVRDAHHVPETPYRFRLWLDADWRHPSAYPGRPPGGWFMRNLEFGPAA